MFDDHDESLSESGLELTEEHMQSFRARDPARCLENVPRGTMDCLHNPWTVAAAMRILGDGKACSVCLDTHRKPGKFCSIRCEVRQGRKTRC